MEIQARSLRGIGYLNNSKEKIIIIQFFVVAKQGCCKKIKIWCIFLVKNLLLSWFMKAALKKNSYELFRNKMFMLQTNTPKFGIQKAM